MEIRHRSVDEDFDMERDPAVDPYYDVTYILCGFVFCSACRCEVVYTSPHCEYTDEKYYDQAVAMQQQGWTISSDDPLDVVCPACAKINRLEAS